MCGIRTLRLLVLVSAVALLASFVPEVLSASQAIHAEEYEGTVWLEGGEFWMGSDSFTDSLPWHRVHVDGFSIDKTEVTNEQFERFVSATDYLTVAEKRPTEEEMPEVPAANLVAGSVVFSPPTAPVPMTKNLQWWSFVKGAQWRHPNGPGSDIKGKERHPVVHMAYEDAQAYCRWAGKRLPTEAEFEFAARGGLEKKTYAWGDGFRPQGRWMANTFQGHFPGRNSGEDGYIATAPVATYSANNYGLYDLAGNVWEWCSDWYRPDYYRQLAENGAVARNPTGPKDSYDPGEPGIAKLVHKGGSYLCTDQYCRRYEPGGRGKGAPDTGTNHLGFRCVK